MPEVLNFGLFISEKKADNIGMASLYRVEKWRENYPPDPGMLQETLVAEGYRVYRWSDPPGATYGSHRHDTDQSHWIVSGSLELVVNEAGPFVLSAGDRDFMPARTYHTAKVIGNEPVTYLVGERAPAANADDEITGERAATS
jgi:quercetin dioxygenase-like cupin family protein